MCMYEGSRMYVTGGISTTKNALCDGSGDGLQVLYRKGLRANEPEQPTIPATTAAVTLHLAFNSVPASKRTYKGSHLCPSIVLHRHGIRPYTRRFRRIMRTRSLTARTSNRTACRRTPWTSKDG